MADYYLKSWSNGLDNEAQTSGEPTATVYDVNLANTAITTTLVNGDLIHFAQVSGNKKPFLELTSLLIEAGVPSSQYSLCYKADTVEVVVLTGGAYTTGTAVRDVPAVGDYIANTGVSVTDSVHDYYLKVVGTPGATPTGNVWVTLSKVANTGIAPANNQ